VIKHAARNVREIFFSSRPPFISRARFRLISFPRRLCSQSICIWTMPQKNQTVQPHA